MEESQAQTEAAVACPIAAARQRVLIIEDNEDAAESLREVLEFDDHDVAYDGPMGISKAIELRPTVILCDIGLPGIDGYDVARAIRAEPSLKDVAMVALSGYALPDDLRRAKQAGFDRHMAKPPSLEQINELLLGLSKGEPRKNDDT